MAGNGCASQCGKETNVRLSNFFGILFGRLCKRRLFCINRLCAKWAPFHMDEESL